MTPEKFIAKWSQTTTRERAASQEHFIDICHLLGERTPNEADPVGEWYAFDKGAKKTGAGDGWADVWKKNCFGWEYKGKGKDLSAALKQLQLYALGLQSPPLLIVSDMETIQIHTAFQNAVQETHIIALEDLRDPEVRHKLKWIFSETDVARLRPTRTRDQITAEAAGKFGELANQLRTSGNDPHAVAHFLNRLLFCMFAEDAGVLPTGIFTQIATSATENADHIGDFLTALFRAMKNGGPFGTQMVSWFNGGLFDDESTLPLTLTQIRIVRDLSLMDWSQIEPSIFGTLFERGLDPSKRSQLGAQYTDPETILRLVKPTIVEPLLCEWAALKPRIERLMERAEAGTTKAATKNIKTANQKLQGFLDRLRNFRVLDPACGSGNFLYIALRELKNIEHRVALEAETMGLERQFPGVGPECVHGIELNSYAAELARVTIWIGELQWMISHGYQWNTQPVLKPLNAIEERDAIMNPDGTEPEWPNANVIVGNPPFLGDKRMRGELGDSYVERLRTLYSGRVLGGADLVTYWYEKAKWQLENDRVERVGLVATNSIRQPANRRVLESLASNGLIYHAWSDEEWVNDGAAVRVSLICFAGRNHKLPIQLDGSAVPAIQATLTPGGRDEIDLTRATALKENAGCSYFGFCLAGDFSVTGDAARKWLVSPNPHGRPNKEVLRPLYNGNDVFKRSKDRWLIDFGPVMDEKEAALYADPFAYVLENVKPARLVNREPIRAQKWWRLGRPRPELRRALVGLSRYIATPETAKHRVFVWLSAAVAPEHRLVVIPRSDDETLGVLSSRYHVSWALAQGGTLEDRPVYNSMRCFETFPFPTGLVPNVPATQYASPHARGVAAAAQALVLLRDAWLNPPEWVDVLPEVVSGYPDRLIAKPGHEADLKKRTLTNLYNQKPTWLVNAHRQLDDAVAAAYGWPVDLSDDEILKRLLELNLSRAAKA